MYRPFGKAGAWITAPNEKHDTAPVLAVELSLQIKLMICDDIQDINKSKMPYEC